MARSRTFSQNMRIELAHRPVYEVIVSNIGKVYETTMEADARNMYDSYVRTSLSGYGRAHGEAVMLFCDDEILEDHVPPQTIFTEVSD